MNFEQKQIMKTAVKFLAAGLLLASVASASANVHYVDVNSTNATPPFTNWATAATNIQESPWRTGTKLLNVPVINHVVFTL